MSVRTNTEVDWREDCPTFGEGVKAEDGFSGFWCQRCGEPFAVHEETWRQSAARWGFPPETRPCPYCFKVSKLPPAAPKPQPKMKIRRR